MFLVESSISVQSTRGGKLESCSVSLGLDDEEEDRSEGGCGEDEEGSGCLARCSRTSLDFWPGVDSRDRGIEPHKLEPALVPGLDDDSVEVD